MAVRGKLKNARNMLNDLIIRKRHGTEPTEEQLEYALRNVKEALEELEEADQKP